MGVAGVDTRDYPGNNIMHWLFENTNLKWTGFYLTPAPCQGEERGWMSKYDDLKNMGWGFAPIFVGQQPPGHNCASNILTEAQGTKDAELATNLSSSAGFVDGSVIYLDIESGSLSNEFMLYITGWIGEMISINKYSPGVYCSHRNANKLKNESLAAAFWVWKIEKLCPPPPFPTDPPSNSGIKFANVWQRYQNCVIDAGGTRINVDLNTSTTSNPSMFHYK